MSTIWVGVVSELWNHRNFVVFNRDVADASEVFTLVQVKVWSWISVKTRSAWFSYSNWCLEPLVCMRMVSWSFFRFLRVGLLLVSLVVSVKSWFLCILHKGWTTPEVVPIYLLLLIKKNHWESFNWYNKFLSNLFLELFMNRYSWPMYYFC